MHTNYHGYYPTANLLGKSTLKGKGPHELILKIPVQ